MPGKSNLTFQATEQISANTQPASVQFVTKCGLNVQLQDFPARDQNANAQHRQMEKDVKRVERTGTVKTPAQAKFNTLYKMNYDIKI